MSSKSVQLNNHVKSANQKSAYLLTWKVYHGVILHTDFYHCWGHNSNEFI